MIGLFSTSTHAPYNLATEQYLLHHFTEDVFFLYLNQPSIIVGKHQNTLAEINYQFINEHDIPVYRRLSGGGTVYHDLGNLNFCFIKSGKRGELVDFEGSSRPIQKALLELGITTEFGKRHDLLINGKKISGNASHVYKNRVMHHGTLLFNSDLALLNHALKTNPTTFIDRAVKSVRSEVTNISQHLTTPITTEAFCQHIYQYVCSNNSDLSSYILSKEDQTNINQLVTDKYDTWVWNYGYSPSYELKKRLLTSEKIRFISHLNVEKGIITKTDITSSNNNYKTSNSLLSQMLIGQQHEKRTLMEVLKTWFEKNSERKDYLELLPLFI